MTTGPTSEGPPDVLRRLRAGSPLTVTSASSAVACVALYGGVVHHAVATLLTLVGLVIALGSTTASISDRWSKVRSASRRRKAVDQMIEHLAIEYQKEGMSLRRRKQYRAELQALFDNS